MLIEVIYTDQRKLDDDEEYQSNRKWLDQEYKGERHTHIENNKKGQKESVGYLKELHKEVNSKSRQTKRITRMVIKACIIFR